MRDPDDRSRDVPVPGPGPIPEGSGSCSRTEDAAAFVQGELPPELRDAFERHLADCPACRAGVEDAREVLRALGETSPAPAESPGGADLIDQVMARIEAEAPMSRKIVPASLECAPIRRARFSGARPAVLAAAALILLSALILLADRSASKSRPPGKAPPDQVPVAAADADAAARDEALAWLAAAQEPSGGWIAERWGGSSAYDTGLTGLSVIALLGGGASRDKGPASRMGGIQDSAARGIGFLLGSQADDGRFGPEGRAALYNTGVATVALLEAHGAGRPDLHSPIDRALAHLDRARAPGGGWGYLGEPDGEANTASTCWPLQAFLLARGLGWKGLDPAIAGGFSHLGKVLDERGRAGYRGRGEFPSGPDTLTSMGAFCVLLAGRVPEIPADFRRRLLDEAARSASRSPLDDLYRGLFLSHASRALPPGAPADMIRRPLEGLAAAQVHEGAQRGSWDPRGPWAAAGGRLYATALGAIILDADRRAPRLLALASGRG